MVEIGNKGQENINQETLEQVEQRLLEYIHNAEFGSPVYQAAIDYFEEDRLSDALEKARIDAKENQNKSKDSQMVDSELRIAEIRYALLQDDIRIKKSQVKGYWSAYNNIDEEFTNVAGAAGREARAKFPDDETRMEGYLDNLYQTVHTKADFATQNKAETTT